MLVVLKLTQPPSRNQSERTARTNRYAAATLKRTWTARIAKEVASQSVVTFDNPVYINAVFEYKTVRQDSDNLLGCLKYVMDGIITTGMLKDDTVKHIISINSQFKLAIDKVNPKIILHISDTQEGNTW